jgi:glutathione S-transferase
MWSDCRARFGAAGPFLFGAFSAADAMYAPVVLRFRTYAVELPPACRAYADAVLALAALGEWIEAAERETESLPQFEMYG